MLYSELNGLMIASRTISVLSVTNIAENEARVRAALEDDGRIRLTAVSDSAEALVQLHNQEHHAVILDFSCEFLIDDVKRIREDSPGIAIVVLSRNSTSRDVAALLAAGVNEFTTDLDSSLSDTICHGIQRQRLWCELQEDHRALQELITAVKPGQIDSILGTTTDSDVIRLIDSKLVEKNERVTRELERINEELQSTLKEYEKNSETLKTQKGEIEERNRALDAKNWDIEQKSEELEAASKFKSEFMANMSHELRTPLNSMLVLSQSLAENGQGNLTDDQVTAAGIVYTGGQSLLELINDILDLSKAESGSMDIDIAPVDLQALAESLRIQFTPIAEDKGLELEVDLAANLGETLATDGRKLEQILRNLVSNALKFTVNGAVTFRIGYANASTQFNRGDLTAESTVAFSVTDSGIGIAKDKQQAVFSAFQQVDGSLSRKYGGTGLGLSISSKFAEVLGGEIQLESRPDEGSTFTLYVPLEPNILATGVDDTTCGTCLAGSQQHAGTPAVAETIAETAPAEVKDSQVFVHDDRLELKPGDRTILIVEDDKLCATMIVDICHSKGLKCLVAKTGADALSMTADYNPSAVLLDLGLPDMDGMVVLGELKNDLATRHIPVQIVTGRESSGDALLQGAIGVQSKPIASDKISQALDEIDSVLDADVKRLLVIEDDDLMQRFVGKTVQFEGVEITAVTSGSEGYEHLRDGDYDCVILDLNLGTDDIDGFEILRKLKEQSISTPPVVVHSGADLSHSEQEELQSFGCAVVNKMGAAPGLLADKVSLFLHCLESSIPASQRRRIKTLHDPADLLRNQKVLMVDDDMRSLFAMSRMLESAGLQVVVAENGKRALEELDRADDINIVLMDIMMPVMNGYDAIRAIRAQPQYQMLPIIVLTADSVSGDWNRCLQAGASSYMNKPLEVTQLLSLMRVWSTSQSPVLV